MATLDDCVECNVCFDVYEEPKFLTCQHTFCLPCLVRLVDPESPTFTCPQCRAVHLVPDGGVANLPTDIRTVRLLEATGKSRIGSSCWNCRKEEAESDCEHCNKKFCDGCLTTHHKHCVLDNISVIEKLLTDDFVQQANDLKQKLLEIQLSIQSAKTELTNKVRSHISELELVLQSSLSKLDQRSAVIDVSMADLNEITANPDFHWEAKALIFTLDNKQDLLELNMKSEHLATLISKHSTSQHDIASPLTYNVEDAELTEAINNYCTITFRASPEFESAVCSAETVSPIRLAYLGKSVKNCIDVRNKVTAGGSYNLSVCPDTDDIYWLHSEDNRSFISVYRPDGTFVRDIMIRGKRLWAIAVTDDRHIVATFSHGVMVIDEHGRCVRQFGSLGSGREQFYRPYGVAYSRGHVYVADTGNHCIKVLTEAGDFVDEFGKSDLVRPYSIAVDNHGTVVVGCDHAVSIFEDGELVGECGSDRVQYSWRVCVDRHEYILVAHGVGSDDSLDVFTYDGDHHAAITDPVRKFNIRGLAVTSTGDVVLFDERKKAIMIF